MRCPLLLLLIPAASAIGQLDAIRPYARIGRGYGTLGYDDASIYTLEAGLLLNRYLAVSGERMRLAGTSEFGTWTVATARLYPLTSTHRASPWVAAGVGSASAEAPDPENSAASKWYRRFSGLGFHSAVGIDIRTVPHLFIVPSVAIRQTSGDAEEQQCMTNFTTWTTTCGAWEPRLHKFRTLELTISVAARR
jgi:hypothetical protein